MEHRISMCAALLESSSLKRIEASEPMESFVIDHVARYGEQETKSPSPSLWPPPWPHITFFFFSWRLSLGDCRRVQLDVRDVLRVRRRQVQLPEQRAVRDAGRVRVRQPGHAPQLGRHPPHRGRVQADHRRMAQRALLPPAHPSQLSMERGRQ
uniref:Uncharacterized protein n=1 Tax=Arundo donax TaxID=35708 RepID=A0A0A9C7Y2_ARUDO